MSWSHVAWAARQTAGGGTNKLVLLMIADSTSHDSPMLVIKMERMMKLCELKERTVRDALRDLEDRGLIGTVLRFFEGQQIANGYFLIGEEWVAAAKDRIDAENHRDGFSCRLRSNTVRDAAEGCSTDSRSPFDGRPAPDAPLGGRQMPGGEAPDAGQLLPSSSLPSSTTEFLESKAFAGATKQQPESALTISDLAPAPRPRKQSRSAKPAIPNVADFVAWAAESHPGWEREAEAWHKRMASQDWLKGNGEQIKNAKGAFNTAMANGWVKRIVGSSTGWAKL